MTIDVYGIPVAQGSMRGFVVRGGKYGPGGGHAHAVVTHANPQGLGAWRQSVAAAAMALNAAPLQGPVLVHATFWLPRPKSRAKRHLWPDTRPDLDKLARAVLDALTGIAWANDAAIVDLHAQKAYALPTRPPGVSVTWEPQSSPGRSHMHDCLQ